MNPLFTLLQRIGLLPVSVESDRSPTSLVPAQPRPQPPSSPLASYLEREAEALSAPSPSVRPERRMVAYQTLWLQELIRTLLTKRDPRMAGIFTQGDKRLSVEQLDEETYRMMNRITSMLKGFALEFNAITLDIPGFDSMRIGISELSSGKEEQTPKSYGAGRKAKTYVRFRLSTSTWCLSVRGHRGRIEFYLLPASEIFILGQAETPVRLRSAISLNERLGMDIWTSESLPVDPDEIYYLCRLLVRSLMFASAQDLKEELDSTAVLQTLEGDALKTTLRELLLTGQNMAQKIVSQQEEIQNRIARDLHDTVIADIMALKRSVTGDAELTADEISTALDRVSQNIREICHDLTPRDLRDWGLQTVVEDLLQRVAQRTGADCTFECDSDLPEFPFAVQLHLFRIIQECLNNIEKYAEPTRVAVRFEVGEHAIRLTMSDDGKGYDVNDLEARRAREGGTGLSGIRERAEMIRCFYPTRLKFESAPGRGAVTVLELRMGESV